MMPAGGHEGLLNALLLPAPAARGEFKPSLHPSAPALPLLLPLPTLARPASAYSAAAAGSSSSSAAAAACLSSGARSLSDVTPSKLQGVLMKPFALSTWSGGSPDRLREPCRSSCCVSACRRSSQPQRFSSKTPSEQGLQLALILHNVPTTSALEAATASAASASCSTLKMRQGEPSSRRHCAVSISAPCALAAAPAPA
jgi:hypothetical protein